VRVSEGTEWEEKRQGGASTFELELPFVRRSARAIELPYCSTSQEKTVDEY